MPNKTTNYQLNQWEPGDNFLRTDFNEDNARIDSALKGLADQMGTKASQGDLNNLAATVSGKAEQSGLDNLSAAVNNLVSTVNTKASQSDLANGLAAKCEVVFGSYTGDGASEERTISLGFTPKAIFVNMSKGTNANYLDGCTSLLALQNAPAEQLRVVTGGFAVKNLFNHKSYYNPYYYIAFK